MCCTGHLPTVQAAYSATGSPSKTHYPRRVAISDASASPPGSHDPASSQESEPPRFPGGRSTRRIPASPASPLSAGLDTALRRIARHDRNTTAYQQPS